VIYVRTVTDSLYIYMSFYKTVFLMGHAPVKKHLNIIDLFDGDPNCRFCKLETETAYHII
jgi:hypothetical protein